MFELAGVGMARIDPPTHRFSRVNPRLAEMTGYSVEELLGLTTLELTHPDDRGTYQAEWAKAVRGQKPRFELEKRYLRKDGLVLWVSVTATIIRDPGGQPLYALATIQEITERKRREANLAFLAEVSQDLAGLTHIEETMNALGEKVAAHLGLSAVAFAELDETAAIAFINYGWNRGDVPSTLGTYRMEEFMVPEVVQDCRAGRAVIIRDVFADPRTDGEQYAAFNIGSFVSMPLVRGGVWRFLLVVYRSEPYDWRDDEIELIRELTTRIWTRLERARAEEALQASEEKYRTLFETVDEGFCVQELVFDERGEVTDIIYHEANAAFERHTGVANANGKRASEILPRIEQQWFDALRRVYQTGVPERTEGYNADTERWFTAQYLRIGGAGSPFVAAVFEDITERKEREQRQEFLLKFSDALRAEQGTDAVANRALEMLVEYLGLDRSYITTYDLENDRADLDYQIGNDSVPPLPDRFVLSDYPAAFESTKQGTLVIYDELERQGLSEEEKRNSGKLGMRAMVAATLRKDKNKPLWSMVAVSSRPRHWTNGEIALVEEVAERTWAAVERARAEEALAASEEKYRTLFDSMDEGVSTLEVIFDENGRAVDCVYLEHNQALTRLTGLSHEITGKRISDFFTDLEPIWLETYGRVARTGTPERFEHAIAALNRWFDVFVARVGGADSRTIVVLYNDITERKRAEQRQAYLLKLSDALRPLTVPGEIQAEACRVLGEHLGASRVNYAEVEGEEYVVAHEYRTEGLPSMMGRYPINSFRPAERAAFEAGRTVSVADIMAEPSLTPEEAAAYGALGVRAFVSVPLVKAGRLVVVLSVIRSRPGPFFPHEVALVEETAERTWAAVERGKAEQALRESEQRLQRMVNVPQVGVLTFDYSGALLRANDAFLEMVGYRRDEFEARQFTWRDFTPSEYVEASERVMANLLKTGRGGPYEKEYFRKDGSRVWLMFVAADLGDGTIVEYAIDISHRKQAEQARLESERRLRLALSAGQFGTWHFDLARGVGTASERTWEIFGGSGQQPMTLERWIETIHPDDRERARQEFAKAASGAGLFDLEYRLLRPDGGERWVRVTGSLTHDAAGQPLSLDGVITDITERRRSEEDQAWLAAIVESSIDAILSFDREGRILTWNHAAERMFGYQAAEVIGRPLQLFVPPGLEADQAEILQRVRQGQHVNQHDTQRLSKDGTLLEVSLTVSPIQNPKGEIIAATSIIQDIRRRKRAERALRKSQERYRELVSQVKDYAIFRTDPQGVITTWNEGCQRVLGYAEEEFIGLDFHHLFPPEAQAAGVPQEELETAARLGSCSDDRWMLRKGGERFWATGTLSALHSPRGKLSGFTKVMRDLTPQMQAEVALRQNQERLALTLEAGGLGIWDSDLVNHRTYWSPEQEKLFGLEPGRFDGRFSERLHPEDRRRVLMQLREALEGGGDYQDEYRVVWPDGTVRWLAARGRVYRDPAGRAVRILGVNYDVTERRRAEAAFQESEERFRVMADHSPLMIWVTDPGGRVEFVNRAYREFFGVSTEQAQQEGWPPLLHPEDRESYIRPFLKCLREHRSFWGQARVRHKSGEWRWIASYAAPRFSASGEFLGMVGSSPDISEIKEAEAQLREMIETQRRFVADASHELRAPLASVLGNLELLHRYPAMPEEDRQLALRDAYGEASRMARLVHDLLALARGDEGLRLRHEPVRLDALLSEALRQARLLDGSHRLERSLLPITVRGDPDRLKELFVILLDNALKYTPAGGTIRLELSAQAPPGEKTYAEVRVSDSGVGIAPEDLPHVFERFYRSDKARSRGEDPGGTGLGLSIAKQIVEAHGGEIRLESQVGRGTTAIVRLPTA